MSTSYDPLAGKLLPMESPAPGSSPALAVDADSPAPARPAPSPFVPPPMPDPVLADLATVSDADRDRIAANHDADVAQKWAEYQGRVLGLGPEDRTALPPDYITARQVVADSRKHHGLFPEELQPDNPPADPRDDFREPTQFTFGRAANQALDAPAPPDRAQPVAPAPRPSGGGVGPPAHDYGADWSNAFDDRIRAMEDESRARVAGASDVAGAFENAAEEQRGEGLASMAQAKANADAQRARIAEVDQLNRDYAAGQIDPNRWWSERNVPQKIAAVLGGMLAGIGGGVRGAVDFHNQLVDRDIALQRDDLERKYKAGMQADNLLASFMRTSDSEQEAMDKARAALIGSSITEVEHAQAAAKGPVEKAQIDQLIADMRATRAQTLAKIQAQRQAGAAASQVRGLEIDPNMLVTSRGEQFLVPHGDAEAVRQNLDAYDRLEDNLREGLDLLNRRGALDYLPTSANMREASSVDASVAQNLARLANARGIPPSIAQLAKEEAPSFGSTFAKLDVPKAQRMLRMLKQYRGDMLQGSVPVDVQTGPGVGKEANKLTYWATPRALRPAAEPEDALDRPSPGAVPR